MEPWGTSTLTGYSSKDSHPELCEAIYYWEKKKQSQIETRKKPTFLEVINKPIIYKFSKHLTDKRNKISKAFIFSYRTTPIISGNRNPIWHLPTIWKTRFPETHIEKFS